MQLRYLEKITLKKASKEKQENGSRINTYTDINDYLVQVQDVLDETSVSVYGATVNKMYRISSPLNNLETFLKTKLVNKSDNISLYYVAYNNALFSISAVKRNWIDIEFKEPL